MRYDLRDLAGGGILLLVGLAFSAYAVVHYDVGTVRRMGPGMFPVALGLILAAFGAMQAVPALFRSGQRVSVEFRTPFFVLLGVAAFALVIGRFGMVPAIIAVVILSSLAERKFRPASQAGLCLFLCALSVLTFHVGLGLAIPMARWPF